MLNQGMAVDKCGPCLSEKEIKKRNEQEAKDIKGTINYLAAKFGYEKNVTEVVGGLVINLIRLTGPLK